ncbi:MAG: hypothetical protein AAB757_00985 [Patescibacteria group bacterium]
MLKLEQLIRDLNEERKGGLSQYMGFKLKISYSEKDKSYFWLIILNEFMEAYSHDVLGGRSEIVGTGISFEEAYKDVFSKVGRKK